MSYGKASFLLDWNGGGGAFVYEPDGGETNPWNPAWTVSIGAPAAPKQRIGTGWLRRYSGGVALVNPSSSSSQRFDLGRAYRTLDGETLSQITLPPVTGAVLTSPVRARASGEANGPARSATSGRP
jgi:hypothetical protein